MYREPQALCTYIFPSFTCLSFPMSIDVQGPCVRRKVWREAAGGPGVARVAGVEGARGHPAGAPHRGLRLPPCFRCLHAPVQGPWHPDLHSAPRTEVLGRLRRVCLQGP